MFHERILQTRRSRTGVAEDPGFIGCYATTQRNSRENLYPFFC